MESAEAEETRDVLLVHARVQDADGGCIPVRQAVTFGGSPQRH